MSDFDTRLCVDEERLAIPQKPDRHSLWSAIATGSHKPDHQLLLQAAQRMFARRNHIDKYRHDGGVIPVLVAVSGGAAIEELTSHTSGASRSFDRPLRRGD
jgi:hypothetical protein